MDWLIATGAIVAGWAVLALLGGERDRMYQTLQAQLVDEARRRAEQEQD